LQRFVIISRRLRRLLDRLCRLRPVLDSGQTTAEYGISLALVGVIAVVAINWARSTDAIPQLFDTVIKQLLSGVA
jgi:hypothetical protein